MLSKLMSPLGFMQLPSHVQQHKPANKRLCSDTAINDLGGQVPMMKESTSTVNLVRYFQEGVPQDNLKL